jgi:5-methylcytosine-specific restriction protein A
MGLEHHRHSKRVTRTRQWQVLRMAVLERDGWACVDCGARRRLEVDHIRPVRTHPELSYSLANCATRCRVCHARKTRVEIGHKPTSPARQEWRDLVQDMHPNPEKEIDYASQR